MGRTAERPLPLLLPLPRFLLLLRSARRAAQPGEVGKDADAAAGERKQQQGRCPFRRAPFPTREKKEEREK